MNDDSLKQILASLIAEDEALTETLATTQERLVKVRTALAALSTLNDSLGVTFDGLADACRAVLRTSEKPMTPLEVRDGLKGVGYNLTQHKNEMASIHSVLKRLAESKDVKSTTKDDATRYVWTGEPPLKPQPKPPTPVSTVPVGGGFKSLGEAVAAMQAPAFKDAIAKSGNLAATVELWRQQQATRSDELRKMLEAIDATKIGLWKLPKL